MSQIQNISATEARNNFFNVLKESYLEKKRFLIKKGGIPMVYIIPVNDMANQAYADIPPITEVIRYMQSKYKNLGLTKLVVKERDRLYKTSKRRHKK